MSDIITLVNDKVKKDAENLAEEIKELIEDEMKNQPYMVKCAVCGKELEWTTSLDMDLDLTVEVEPCKECQKTE